MVEFWPRALGTEGAVSLLAMLCRYNYTLYYTDYNLAERPHNFFPREWVERVPVAHGAFVDALNGLTATAKTQKARDFGSWTDIVALSPKVKASYVEDNIIAARNTTGTSGKMCPHQEAR